MESKKLTNRERYKEKTLVIHEDIHKVFKIVSAKRGITVKALLSEIAEELVTKHELAV